MSPSDPTSKPQSQTSILIVDDDPGFARAAAELLADHGYRVLGSAMTADEALAESDRLRPDAILLGTVSPVLSEGTDAIRAYFSNLKGSGNKNAVGERHTMVLNDNAVVVTGFYEYTRMKDGQSVSGPSRFTMLLIKDGGEWLIAHHHSSPRSQPAN